MGGTGVGPDTVVGQRFHGAVARRGLPRALAHALAQHGTPPETVELELTESTLMECAEHALAQLEALKTLGVRLSVDDFCTGYSSLGFLGAPKD